MPEEARLPHAILDLPSRRWKAEKIERLLGLGAGSGPVRMLEIGVGAGGIAHYFATHPSRRYTVEGVDVIDSRMIREGYGFQTVAGTDLPFGDASFDVVLSNHVIEHVGPEASQHAHLAEIRRVLSSTGTGYLAVPNRWMLVEPHFGLAFLSWLPPAWRTPYLRAAGKGELYDCRPLEPGQLEKMLERAGLKFENLCLPALRATLDIERPAALMTRVFRLAPDVVLQPLRTLIPTLIYRFWPEPPTAANNG